jgi:hypothetical protein
MMMTTHPSSVFQKKDLHVGGLGSNVAGAPASVVNPIPNADSWLDTARDMAQDADDYVRKNPWAAIVAVALVSLAAGYLLSQRS